MFRTLALLALLCTAAWTADQADAAETAPRPNVVVILSDDQGWGDLSVHGNTNLSTPNIDSLARDGALFDRFFVCPVCSPTRAEFLTGRYHPRGGVQGVSTGGERLDLDERTIADSCSRPPAMPRPCSASGTTAASIPTIPARRGFDEYLRLLLGPLGRVFQPAAGAQRPAGARQRLSSPTT